MGETMGRTTAPAAPAPLSSRSRRGEKKRERRASAPAASWVANSVSAVPSAPAARPVPRSAAPPAVRPLAGSSPGDAAVARSRSGRVTVKPLAFWANQVIQRANDGSYADNLQIPEVTDFIMAPMAPPVATSARKAVASTVKGAASRKRKGAREDVQGGDDGGGPRAAKSTRTSRAEEAKLRAAIDEKLWKGAATEGWSLESFVGEAGARSGRWIYVSPTGSRLSSLAQVKKHTAQASAATRPSRACASRARSPLRRAGGTPRAAAPTRAAARRAGWARGGRGCTRRG